MNLLGNIFTIYGGREDIRLSKPKWAYAWYDRYKINLLNGKKEKTCPAQFQTFLDEFHLLDNHKKTVIHLTYEFGFYYLFDNYKYKKETLLGIVIGYEKKEKFFPELHHPIKLTQVSSPSLEKYGQAFTKGRKKLLNGDCYQFNLTFPYLFAFKNQNPAAFINQLWANPKLMGAYAHITWIPCFNKMILSNSPECLFQMRKNQKGFLCWSMPIKGSIKVSSPLKYQRAWYDLKRSKKNQAELFMIADMLSNDLSKIEKPQAMVVQKKIPLMVPNILHQCSLIKVQLSKHITLGQIVKNIFPGGSITGAPKKRVVEILQDLENYDREFYTGSTIILDEKVMAGSINIRTAEIDFKAQKLMYKAGGGITLLSNKKAEFKEMGLKLASFLKIFN